MSGETWRVILMCLALLFLTLYRSVFTAEMTCLVTVAMVIGFFSACSLIEAVREAKVSVARKTALILLAILVSFGSMIPAAVGLIAEIT